MEKCAADFGDLNFYELKDRFGLDNACDILQTLEKLEGIPEHNVSGLSYQDRLSNVMSAMKESHGRQTRH